MTPVEYVETVVRPTVLEFLRARDDKRLAYLSCIATYHVCDYIGQTENVEIQDVQAKIETVCKTSLAVVKGLCNGTKHAKPRGAINPTDVKWVPAFAFDVSGVGFDEAVWDGPALYVDDNGNTLFVHHCVQAVLLTYQSIYKNILGNIDFSKLEDFMKDWHRSATITVPGSATN